MTGLKFEYVSFPLIKGRENIIELVDKNEHKYFNKI